MNSFTNSEISTEMHKVSKSNDTTPRNSLKFLEPLLSKTSSATGALEATDACSSKANVSLPDNKFKLKPEQSYKKETKASRLGKSTGRWTHKEHILFTEGLKIYGKNWKKVESYIGTRTGTQIRSHAQKFFNRVKKEFNTEDPSKYVVDHMKDESMRKIVLEHCGDDISISNEEKDFSSDTPEVLFRITKEKNSKKNKEPQNFSSVIGSNNNSAFKMFKREETQDQIEDSKISNKTVFQRTI